MKQLFKKYSHCLLLLYFPFYLGAFYYIEHFGSNKIHIIECALDQQIPFIEYFIIPYFLWFLYMGIGGLYFMLFEKESFIKMMLLGMLGMTVFIIVSLVYPNGLQLRPEVFPRENIFVDLTRYLYSIDTPTNVFPSIHVFNSLGMHCVIMHSEKLKTRRFIVDASAVLCISIVLSTMFLKQHSVFDVISGIALFSVAYGLIYCTSVEKISEAFTAPKSRRRIKYKRDFR